MIFSHLHIDPPNPCPNRVIMKQAITICVLVTLPIIIPYSPLQVCHSGLHLEVPGCGKNGTCWQFHRAEEVDTDGLAISGAFK